MYNPRFEKETFKKEVKQNVKHLFRKEIEEVSQQELYQAVSYAVKEAIIDNWIATQKQYEKDDPKIVYYMSMEFLMGRALGNNLINMTAYTEVKGGEFTMRNQIRLLETAVWDVWRRVSWIRWPLLVMRRTVVESVTATVCSSRRLRTATR